MEYDFKTIVNRGITGSVKWGDMYTKCPDVPADIIPFSTADMELKNPPEIMEGLRKYLNDDELILGYTRPTESYKDAVTGFMERHHNWKISKESMLLSPGVIPALLYSIQAFTAPGDGVIIFTPVYYPFKMGILYSGRELVDIPLIDNEMHYEIDWNTFETRAKETNVKLLLLCSPHNPVGRVWSREELRKIADICIKNNIIVVSDEIHNDLLMPGVEHTVYSTVSKEAALHSVICTAPSKTFNLAGMQTSNIFVENPELREKLQAEITKAGMFNLNVLGYRACEIAYRECDRWLEELLALIDKNRRLAEEYIKKQIPRIVVYPMEGTYLQWWDCRKLGMDEKELERFMQKEAYLFLDEGYLFGETGSGFERINLACPTQVLADALERLKNALARYMA